MSLNQNVIIGANDYGALASLYAFGDPGLAAYPIANLLTPQLYLPLKFSTNDPTKTWFTLDFQKVRTLSLAALLKHNMTYAGTWRIRGYDADPALNSPIYDTGLMSIFPPISGYGVLPWGEFQWGGAIEEYVEVTPLGYNRHSLLPLTDPQLVRYVRYDISDPSNSDPITIARAWNSYGYQPTLNVAYGAKIIPIDETEVSDSRSGVRHYGRIVKRKALYMGFELLPIKEVLFNIFGPIHLRTGKAGDLLAILQPLDPETWFFESVFGNLTETEASEHSFFNRMSTALTIDEGI